MRRTIIVLLTAFMLTLTANFAFAQNPHFIGDPTLTIDGTSVTASGSVAGLGHQDISVTLDASGVAAIECENRGGNRAPGQDTEISVSGTQTDIETKNGRAFFSVTAGPADPPSGGDVCPNRHWTAHIVGVEFTTATLTVEQGGSVVLTYEFAL